MIDLYRPALHALEMAMIRGEPGHRLHPPEEPIHHPGRIAQQTRIGRMMDRHRYHRRVHAHGTRRIDGAATRTRHEPIVHRGERRWAHAIDRGCERRFRRRFRERANPTEGSVGRRIREMK